MRTLRAAAVVALAFGLESGAAQTPIDKRLQPYVAANKLYALQKPADWKVKEDPGPIPSAFWSVLRMGRRQRTFSGPATIRKRMCLGSWESTASI